MAVIRMLIGEEMSAHTAEHAAALPPMCQRLSGVLRTRCMCVHMHMCMPPLLRYTPTCSICRMSLKVMYSRPDSFAVLRYTWPHAAVAMGVGGCRTKKKGFSIDIITHS